MTTWHEYPKTKPRLTKKRKLRNFCKFLCVSRHFDGGFIIQIVDIQYYDFDEKRFMINDDEITHWAKMPEPPKLPKQLSKLPNLEC